MSTWRALPQRTQAECAAYAALAVAGLVGTQLALVALIRDGDVAATVWRDLTSTPSAVFASVDLLVVFLAAMLLMVVEGRRIGLRRWLLYPLLGIAVAVSVGLPLFLLARRLHLAGSGSGEGLT